MRTVVLLFILTFGLFLVLKFVVTPNYGEDVRSRFIERIKYIPSQKPELLTAANLTKWLADAANLKAVNGYVFPVLFPLDVVFLICLGLLLGFASVALADSLTFLSNVPAWVWWVFPCLYMVSDMSEDSLVALIFKSVVPLTGGTYSLLSACTAVKLATISVAASQVGFLAALRTLLYFFPASRPLG